MYTETKGGKPDSDMHVSVQLKIAPLCCTGDGGSHDSIRDVELKDRATRFRGGPVGTEVKGGAPVMIRHH